MRITLFVILFLMLGWIVKVNMDGVPSEELIISSYGVFLINPIEIKGIYSNSDIGSVLFSYTTDEKKTLFEIEKKLGINKWITEKKTKSELVASRTLPPGQGELEYFSFELVKIFHENGKICVGYFQSDSKNKININTQTIESKWARNNLWPKYIQCTTQAAGGGPR